MRGAHVQETKQTAVRPSWRNSRYSAALIGFTGLPNPDALRQVADSSHATTLDASQPHRLWRSPSGEGNSMLSIDSPTHLSRAARRRFYCEGRRKLVLFSHAVKNPNMAFDVDALLAEPRPNKRLGKAEKKLILPVQIWYLWRSTGIRSDTSENWNRATGIRSGTCRAGFSVPQVSDLNHSY